jgi:hypothetical protein
VRPTDWMALGVALAVSVVLTLWVIVWLLRQLAVGFDAYVNYHMRVQVELHKELCRLNDRFTPAGGAPPVPDVVARAQAARDALRGGVS